VRWTFGVDPLPQTEVASGLLRRVAGLVVSMERPEPAVDRLVAMLQEAERDLTVVAPPDQQPRVGPNVASAGRIYLDHSRHIGSYNPCFPEYDITVDGDRASGTVSFSTVYEGPPGIVHGGFIALLIDCVVQHHNCDLGVAGKTSSLTVRFRRPAPLLTNLRFEVERRVDERRITSSVQLLAAGVACAEGEVQAVAGERANLPEVSRRGATR
jgi:hypothetical protein